MSCSEEFAVPLKDLLILGDCYSYIKMSCSEELAVPLKDLLILGDCYPFI
jgi:hypothetical protein